MVNLVICLVQYYDVVQQQTLYCPSQKQAMQIWFVLSLINLKTYCYTKQFNSAGFM